MNEFVVKMINTKYASLSRSNNISGQNSARKPRKKTKKEKHLITEIREMINSKEEMEGTENFNLFEFSYR